MSNIAPRDQRVAAIAVIWGISAGMLGLSIPLVAIAHSDLTLPLVIMMGTVLSTLVIWRTPLPAASSQTLPPAQQAELEQRIADLEVICGLDIPPLPPLPEPEDSLN